MDDTQKRHIAQIVSILSDIVGGQTQVLQRIERGLMEQNKTYKELLKRINLLDKKIQGGFTVLENTRLASMEKEVGERLSNLDYSYLGKLKAGLDSLHTKLQQQVNAQFLQLLIKKSQQIATGPKGKLPSVTKIGRGPSPRRAARVPGSVGPVVSSAAPPTVPQATADVDEEDWMESELEGAQIFDTIIIGWKRRDWESIAKGTREMFMRAWRKLSSTDRQKIRNGTWSKPIIKKMKMMSREL